MQKKYWKILKLKKKTKIYCNQTPLFVRRGRADVDIVKVLVSNKISFGGKNYKYFIGYFYKGNKVKPLNIMLPKTRAYVKSYDGQTKLMYLFIADDDLLKKYYTIWNKVSADIEKEFDSDPVYNREYLKIKIKFHGDEDIYNKKFQLWTLIIFVWQSLPWILPSRKTTIIICKCF